MLLLLTKIVEEELLATVPVLRLHTKTKKNSANSTTSRKDENHMTITYNVSCPGEALYETDLLV